MFALGLIYAKNLLVLLEIYRSIKSIYREFLVRDDVLTKLDYDELNGCRQPEFAWNEAFVVVVVVVTKFN